MFIRSPLRILFSNFSTTEHEAHEEKIPNNFVSAVVKNQLIINFSE